MRDCDSGCGNPMVIESIRNGITAYRCIQSWCNHLTLSAGTHDEHGFGQSRQSYASSIPCESRFVKTFEAVR